MQSYKITDVASVKFDSEGPASEVQEVREHARETAVFVTIPAGRDLLCGPSMLSTRLAELWRNYSVTSPKPASFLHSSWSL